MRSNRRLHDKKLLTFFCFISLVCCRRGSKMLNYYDNPGLEKFKFIFFYSDSFRYIYLARMRFTSSNRHAGMTLGELATQAVTFGKCKITKFAFCRLRVVVHPSALQPYVRSNFNPQLKLHGANLSTPKG